MTLPNQERKRPWYQAITEAEWFKGLFDPEAKGMRGQVSRTAAGTVGAALLLFTTGHVILGRQAARDPEHVCKTDPVRAVYKPGRLEVLGTCKTIPGVVQHISHERDGDLHIRFTTAAAWLSPANSARQHGALVVEYMPSDPWAAPKVGDQLRLLCTWVADHDHGWRAPSGQVFYWNECHPVWGVVPVGATAKEPVP